MRVAILAVLFALTSLQASAIESCKSQAFDSAGKPLTGAAYSMFMSKCTKISANKCDSAAVDKNGMILTGAKRDTFLKTCMNTVNSK